VIENIWIRHLSPLGINSRARARREKKEQLPVHLFRSLGGIGGSGACGAASSASAPPGAAPGLEGRRHLFFTGGPL